MAERDAAGAPELSAVLVVGRRREYAGACLQTLLAQQIDGRPLGARLEVVLIDLAADAAPIFEAAAPQVRRLTLPPETAFAAARATGVEAARAPVVAFLEEHTRVRPGWAAALLAAHAGPWAAVGPRMANANPEFGKSAIIGLLNYGDYAGGRAGECAAVPGHNSSYKRAALAHFGAGLERALANDLVLQQRLRAAGARFYFEPAAVVEHRNEGGLRSIGRGIFLWYRCYGPLRAEHGAWSAGRRLLYVLGAPLFPFYFAAHAIPRLARAHTPGWRRLLVHLPFVLAMQLCGALGQAVGLILGPGDAPQRFTEYELTEPRGPL